MTGADDVSVQHIEIQWTPAMLSVAANAVNRSAKTVYVVVCGRVIDISTDTITIGFLPPSFDADVNEHLIIPSIEPIAAGQSRRLAASIALPLRKIRMFSTPPPVRVGGAPESRFSHEGWMPTHLKRVIVHIGFADMPFRPRQTTTNTEIGEALRQWYRVTEATWTEKSFDRKDN